MSHVKRKYTLATLVLMMGIGIIGVLDCRMLQASGIDGWQVEGMHGDLQVSGSLTESPCVLAMESEDQSVSLGAIPSYHLRKLGDLSKPVAVHFQLKDCGELGNMLRDDLHGGNMTYLPDQLTSFVTVSGVEDPNGHHLLQVQGGAKGIGLRLDDPSHHQLTPGEHSEALIMEEGNSDLLLYAMLERTEQPLAEGPFSVVMNFSLTYH
jgi:fimbrial protein